MRIDLTSSEHSALLVWSAASVSVLVAASFLGIPVLSTFSRHSPLVAYLLLLFIPLLLTMTEAPSPEREQFILSRMGILILSLLAVAGIYLAFTVPLWR